MRKTLTPPRKRDVAGAPCGRCGPRRSSGPAAERQGPRAPSPWPSPTPGRRRRCRLRPAGVPCGKSGARGSLGRHSDGRQVCNPSGALRKTSHRPRGKLNSSPRRSPNWRLNKPLTKSRNSRARNSAEVSASTEYAHRGQEHDPTTRISPGDPHSLHLGLAGAARRMPRPGAVREAHISWKVRAASKARPPAQHTTRLRPAIPAATTHSPVMRVHVQLAARGTHTHTHRDRYSCSCAQQSPCANYPSLRRNIMVIAASCFRRCSPCCFEHVLFQACTVPPCSPSCNPQHEATGAFTTSVLARRSHLSGNHNQLRHSNNSSDERMCRISVFAPRFRGMHMPSVQFDTGALDTFWWCAHNGANSRNHATMSMSKFRCGSARLKHAIKFASIDRGRTYAPTRGVSCSRNEWEVGVIGRPVASRGIAWVQPQVRARPGRRPRLGHQQAGRADADQGATVSDSQRRQYGIGPAGQERGAPAIRSRSPSCGYGPKRPPAPRPNTRSRPICNTYAHPAEPQTATPRQGDPGRCRRRGSRNCRCRSTG